MPSYPGSVGKDFVLIDDDEDYGALVTAFGNSHGVCIDWYASLAEMRSIGFFNAYDVAIIDYQLGQLSGIEIAEYFEPLAMKTPIVLISGHQLDLQKHPLPKSVVQFVDKKLGVDHMIQAAVRTARRGVLSRIWDGLDQRNLTELSGLVARLRRYPISDPSVYDLCCTKIEQSILNWRLGDTYGGLRQIEQMAMSHM